MKEKLSDEIIENSRFAACTFHGLSLTACGKAPSQEAESVSAAEHMTENTAPDNEERTDFSDAAPLKLEEIPEEYLETSTQPGSVVRIDYETNTYDEANRSMGKYAYVYLPYGYDEEDDETRYNIFYVMHGWTGDAEMYLGGENGDRPLKRILDHLIENGDMEPMIVVTPSYYQDNQEKGPSVAEEDSVLTANFYHESKEE